MCGRGVVREWVLWLTIPWSSNCFSRQDPLELQPWAAPASQGIVAWKPSQSLLSPPKSSQRTFKSILIKKPCVSSQGQLKDLQKHPYRRASLKQPISKQSAEPAGMEFTGRVYGQSLRAPSLRAESTGTESTGIESTGRVYSRVYRHGVNRQSLRQSLLLSLRLSLRLMNTAEFTAEFTTDEHCWWTRRLCARSIEPGVLFLTHPCMLLRLVMLGDKFMGYPGRY